MAQNHFLIGCLRRSHIATFRTDCIPSISKLCHVHNIVTSIHTLFDFLCHDSPKKPRGERKLLKSQKEISGGNVFFSNSNRFRKRVLFVWIRKSNIKIETRSQSAKSLRWIGIFTYAQTDFEFSCCCSDMLHNNLDICFFCQHCLTLQAT